MLESRPRLLFGLVDFVVFTGIPRQEEQLGIEPGLCMRVFLSDVDVFLGFCDEPDGRAEVNNDARRRDLKSSGGSMELVPV